MSTSGVNHLNLKLLNRQLKNKLEVCFDKLTHTANLHVLNSSQSKQYHINFDLKDIKERVESDGTVQVPEFNSVDELIQWMETD